MCLSLAMHSRWCETLNPCGLSSLRYCTSLKPISGTSPFRFTVNHWLLSTSTKQSKKEITSHCEDKGHCGACLLEPCKLRSHLYDPGWSCTNRLRALQLLLCRERSACPDMSFLEVEKGILRWRGDTERVLRNSLGVQANAGESSHQETWHTRFSPTGWRVKESETKCWRWLVKN